MIESHHYPENIKIIFTPDINLKDECEVSTKQLLHVE